MNAPIFDFKIMAIAAFVPLIVGTLWYSKLIAGKAWKSASGMTEEKVKSGNMLLILGLGYVFSFLISIALGSVVIHQNGVFSMFQGQEEKATAVAQYLNDHYPGWENNFRTFKHGALHGFITALFFAMPVVPINALFEHRGFKYVLIHSIYWLICASIMGGLICQFSKMA